MEKYFVMFKNKYKLSHKLLYKSLLDKKIGKGNYIIYDYYDDGYRNKYQSLTYIKDGNCFYGGILIEFSDKKSYTKFMLAGKTVINPNYNVLSNIYSIESFSVEDTFIQDLKHIQNEYIFLIEKFNRAEKIIQECFNIKKRAEELISGIKQYEQFNNDCEYNYNDEYETDFLKNINQTEQLLHEYTQKNYNFTKDLKTSEYSFIYIDTKTSDYLVDIENKKKILKEKVSLIFKNKNEIFY